MIAGEQDVITPAWAGHEVAERIPRARYELLTGPGSSHALMMERAEDFIALVLGFVQEHPLNYGRSRSPACAFFTRQTPVTAPSAFLSPIERDRDTSIPLERSRLDVRPRHPLSHRTRRLSPALEEHECGAPAARLLKFGLPVFSKLLQLFGRYQGQQSLFQCGCELQRHP